MSKSMHMNALNALRRRSRSRSMLDAAGGANPDRARDEMPEQAQGHMASEDQGIPGGPPRRMKNDHDEDDR